MAGPLADHTSVSADTPRQTVGSADTPRQTVGSADTPRQTVGSADTPRQTVGSADTPRQTVGSADTPRQTVGSADTPRQTTGLSFPSDLAAAFAAAVAVSRQPGPAAPAASAAPVAPAAPAVFAAALAGSRQPAVPATSAAPAPPPPPSAGSDAPPPPLSAGSDAPLPPLLVVAVSAGWRVAGDQAASRALRLASAHSARQPLQEWVEPSTCVQLEREEGSSPDQRPGLTLSVAAGQPLAIAEIALLSEFGRCELFGDHGEYLATAEAQLEETVDDTQVLSLRHRCRPPVTQLTLQCVSAAGRRQLWLYGLEAVLQPAAVRPPQATFSLPAVLARLEAAATPLSGGAETLRAALASAGARGEPPTMAALAALFAGGRPPPAETPTGGAQKLECGVEGRQTALPAWIEAAVGQCAGRIEERLWQRISPRLDNIERKQDVILERLEKLSLKRSDARHESSH